MLPTECSNALKRLLRSCRDKGRGWVDEGALCLSWWHVIQLGYEHPPGTYATQANRVATRTSTRPPPFPASAPCPYRTGNAHYPIRSSTFSRVTVQPVKDFSSN